MIKTSEEINIHLQMELTAMKKLVCDSKSHLEAHDILLKAIDGKLINNKTLKHVSNKNITLNSEDFITTDKLTESVSDQQHLFLYLFI